MSNAAFDTLTVARKLKAAGVEAEQADAFVEAMARSTGKFVTVKHFAAAVERLVTRIAAVRTELLARIDAVRTKMQAGINAVRTEMQTTIGRSMLIAVGVYIAANALIMTILVIVVTNGAGG